MEAGKPRVIRKVMRYGKSAKDRRPKVVRDRRAGITMERVTARSPRACTNPRCGFSLIETGDVYVKVDAGLTRRLGGRHLPVVEDYHIGCTPPEAKPLMKFLLRVSR